MIMQEKYLLSIGAGLILISFGIILTFGIAASVEDEVTIQNETIGFEQLREMHLEAKEKLQNNTMIENFSQSVREGLYQIKDGIAEKINEMK